MKRVYAVLLLLVVVLALLMLWPVRRPENIVLADAPARHAFRVVFGAGDKDQQKWDGRVEVRGGKLVRLEGWRFWQNDRVDGGRFQLTTRPGTMEDQLHPPKEMPGRTERLIPAGLIVTLEGDGAQVAVESAAGNFAFREN